MLQVSSKLPFVSSDSAISKNPRNQSMHANPYRGRRPRRLLNGCCLVALSLIFVVANIFVTTWLPNLDTPHRSLRSLSSRELEVSDTLNNDILHVVTSRFMQGQHTLNTLAKARLLLFETFCLPTMMNQNVDNFLWFVMTDPNLDPDLLQQLKSLLERRPNFYLVASNDKLLTPSNLTSILSMEQEAPDDKPAMHQRLLMTGDIELLRKQMFDPNRSLLLETRLDADDGLHFDTLSQLQLIAKSLPVDTEGWQIVCSNIHFEWKNDDILEIRSNSTNSISSGKLRVVKDSICVTPGYTLIRHREPPSTDFPAWPHMFHNLVVREWPECWIEDSSIVGEAVETNTGNATRDCWKRMAYFPSAIRSRTVTSAGMSRVETSGGNRGWTEKSENQTKIFWELVQRDFNISEEMAISTSNYMKEHLYGIASDNLKGQWYVLLRENPIVCNHKKVGTNALVIQIHPLL